MRLVIVQIDVLREREAADYLVEDFGNETGIARVWVHGGFIELIFRGGWVLISFFNQAVNLIQIFASCPRDLQILF